MIEFSAKTTISAPAETIWRHLLDVSTYPEWDPSCERIDGTVALNAKLKVFSKLAPGRGFKVTVSELEPNRKMVWAGGMPLGLFKGVRTFALAEESEKGIEFAVHEVFDGLMLPLIAKSLPDMNAAFDGFCKGLKARAEGN